MMRIRPSRAGPIGLILGAILLSWLVLAAGRVGGTFANPLGVAGSTNAILLAIGILVTGGILSAVRTRFVGSSPNAATGVHTNAGDDEALDVLKQRYVAGEIDEATFERQLEALFETETVEDAKRRVENTATSVEQPPESNPEPPVERGSSQSTSHPARRTKTRSRHGHCK